MNKAGRAQVAGWVSALESIAQEMEALGYEEQDKYDGMPENLQFSERAEAFQDAAECLQEAAESIGQVCDSIRQTISF